MSMTDPVADMLARLRNAQMRFHTSVDCRSSLFVKSILDVFVSEGYIDGFEEVLIENNRKVLRVALRYHAGKSSIQKMWRVSRPGRRVYSSLEDLGKVADGWGVYVLSTSKGVLSCRKAREAGVGGEVVCAIL